MVLFVRSFIQHYEGRTEGRKERRKEGKSEGRKERRKEGKNEGSKERTKEVRKERRKEGRKKLPNFNTQRFSPTIFQQYRSSNTMYFNYIVLSVLNPSRLKQPYTAASK